MRFQRILFFCYTPMQEVTPKVVAMAGLLESREELFQKALHLFIDSSRGF